MPLSSTVKIIRYLVTAYPWRTAVALGLLLVAGVAEGFGVMTILPVLNISSGGGMNDTSGISRMVADALGLFGLPVRLDILLSIFVAGILLKNALTLLAMQHVGHAAAGFAADLRISLIQSLMKARWSYFTDQSTGSLANSMSSEALKGSGAYISMCKMFAEAVQATVYAIMALWVSWYVTAGALIFGFVIFACLAYFIRLMRRMSHIQTTALKSLVSRLTDGIISFKVLKAMGREDCLGPFIEHEANDIRSAERRQVVAKAASVSAPEPLIAIFLSIGMFIAISNFKFTFSEFIFMAVLFQRTVARIAAFQNSYQNLVRTEPVFVSLKSAIDRAAAEREDFTGTKPPVLRSSISLRDVSFCYGENVVLGGIDLTIPVGKFTAVVGPSGAGKTTIVDLIVGLIRPNSGDVWMDDVPLADVDFHAWREKIGYVPQETILFHDTILANVTLNQAGLTASDAEAALKAAGAWGFISDMPEGLYTTAGERGGKLSGGQRQRIAIARALIRGPELLILDEPTTALDPSTEAEICETLRKLSGSVTIFAISHQRAIMEAADVVYRVEDGIVVKSIEHTIR
ncbi:MAG: ABC transporter ATP-binding protein [Nitrospinota bacterium]|jgi:ATP-binding cassette subfamily C protein|nr:ABC transporter ATP-binding protein [Nitrospinota bacterium]MDP7505056.1 ABC transporter ATP-binding protein [Nitrospinota bacterium]